MFSTFDHSVLLARQSRQAILLLMPYWSLTKCKCLFYLYLAVKVNNSQFRTASQNLLKCLIDCNLLVSLSIEPYVLTWNKDIFFSVNLYTNPILQQGVDFLIKIIYVVEVYRVSLLTAISF